MLGVDHDEYDVVIVGAGISGLVVARQLQRHGHATAVLESRERVGGRLRSFTSSLGGSLDLGASWFWPGEQRVERLVSELGLRTHAHHLDGDALYQAPAPTAGNPSFGERLDGNPIDVPSGRFSDGADALTAAIADRLAKGTVRTGSAVRHIVADGDRLGVATETDSITAHHVVLALPPALAVSRIDFAPALPDAVAAVAARTPVWMGAIAKVVITFERPFWRDLGLAGSAISHLGPMREVHDMSGPDGVPAALFGFVPLTDDHATPTETDIRVQLAQLFGPALSDPTEIVIASWGDEPDTAPPDVARLTDYRTFGHPIFHTPTLEGRLHWSSTETATEAPGHIEGALQAAERAADAVHAALTGDHQPTTGSPFGATD